MSIALKCEEIILKENAYDCKKSVLIIQILFRLYLVSAIDNHDFILTLKVSVIQDHDFILFVRYVRDM